MAEITMTTSEYDALIESKKSLERSLEREMILQEQINKLNKELEHSQKTLIKITKSEITEHMVIKREDYNNMLNELENRLNEFSYLYEHKTVTPEDLKIILTLKHNDIRDLFFKKVKTTSCSEEREITYGIDGIKSELRNKLDDEIKSKIKQAEENILKYDNLLEENIELDEMNISLSEMNKKLIKDFEELQKKLFLYENYYDDFNRIRLILNDKRFFRSRYIQLKKIIKIVQKKWELPKYSTSNNNETNYHC
jgi:hypothetical protein